MRKETMSFGRSIEYRKKLEHPERTAMRMLPGVFSDVQFQVWPNRASMAKSIRMQQTREYRQGDWKAVVALTEGEGY